jgi:hypothetical protein
VAESLKKRSQFIDMDGGNNITAFIPMAEVYTHRPMKGRSRQSFWEETWRLDNQEINKLTT